MKTFTYSTNGLSYTVTVYEENGLLKADIQVTEGFMDVNAVYWGDDDQSNDRFDLGGPLNMNGAGSQLDGQAVNWDSGLELTRPGLSKAAGGLDKWTYLTADEGPLTIDLPAGLTLDDIDYFGIRATSSSNPEGSIKGVSEGEEEEPPCDPVFDKVGFFIQNPNGQEFVLAIGREELEDLLNADDPEGTLTDYFLAAYEKYKGDEFNKGFESDFILEIRIYDFDDSGNLTGTWTTIPVNRPVSDFLSNEDGGEGLPLPLVDCTCDDPGMTADDDTDEDLLVA